MYVVVTTDWHNETMSMWKSVCVYTYIHTHMQIASGASDARVNPWLGCTLVVGEDFIFLVNPKLDIFCATTFAEVRRSGYYDIHILWITRRASVWISCLPVPVRLIGDDYGNSPNLIVP
jgi:hypothetical protein